MFRPPNRQWGGVSLQETEHRDIKGHVIPLRQPLPAIFCLHAGSSGAPQMSSWIHFFLNFVYITHLAHTWSSGAARDVLVLVIVILLVILLEYRTLRFRFGTKGFRLL